MIRHWRLVPLIAFALLAIGGTMRQLIDLGIVAHQSSARGVEPVLQRRYVESLAVQLAPPTEASPGAWIEVDPARPVRPRMPFVDMHVPYSEAFFSLEIDRRGRAARLAPRDGVAILDLDGAVLAVTRVDARIFVLDLDDARAADDVLPWHWRVSSRPFDGAVAVEPPPIVTEPSTLFASRLLGGQPVFFHYYGLLLALIGATALSVDFGYLLWARWRESARAVEREAMLQRLSHQLRTPAASALSLAGSLHTIPMSDADRGQMSEVLVEELTRLSDGLDRLLRAARGDEAAIAEPVVVDLSSWSDTVKDRWIARLDRLSVVVDAGVVARVDPDQLDEAADILLDNARRYGVQPVRLSIERRGRQAIVAVSDSGPGVPLDQRQRIFRKFERGASGEGFGLGLWAASAIAAANGGQLGLVGANRFELRLPLVR